MASLPVKTLIKPSEYRDSVSLMLVAQEVSRLSGVVDAAVVMATEANKNILKEAGLLTPEASAASANDLVIAVSGAADVLDQCLLEAEKIFQKRQTQAEAYAGSVSGEYRPKTLRGALKANLNANIAVISVAGRYAADEAWEALQHGLHVLLFSDNVTLEDEIALKQYAAAHGLLLMGPGAGTAILNGVALGFANVIPPGPVGIVSAAGTGLQEVSTLLARYGVGITQGIGTGGRDLKQQVGGIMMLAGLRALQGDPTTQVIVLVSKPPAAAVAQKVLDQVALSAKPTVVCFLGGEFAVQPGTKARFYPARTLEQAARLAAQLSTTGQVLGHAPGIQPKRSLQLGTTDSGRGPRYLRALFSGGTLCYEAQVIWRDLAAERNLPITVYSNAPLDEQHRLPDSIRSLQHSAIDLGEEEFTVGRLHPMIDNDLRIRRMLQEARDPETAVILLDVVLGYGAHPDPAVELGSAARKAYALASEERRELVVVASVTGTEQDPQRLSRQVQALQDAGVVVCESNAAAARFAAGVFAGAGSLREYN